MPFPLIPLAIQAIVSALAKKAIDTALQPKETEMEIVMGLVRHGLTALGGVLVAKGYADADMVNSLAGGGAALIGVIWSVLEKTRKS